jgi:hypothetical protein
MSIHKTALFGIAITAGALARPARAADDPWGTVEDAEKCAKELTSGTAEWVNGSWVSFDKEALKTPDKASAECKAELDRRADACLKDAAMQNRISTAQGRNAAILKRGGANGPKMLCVDEAFQRIKVQREKAAADKKFEAEAKAKVAATELPEGHGKVDKNLEKMITTAYKKEFPDRKTIRVLLLSDDWTHDKNVLSQIIGRDFTAALIDQPSKDKCMVYIGDWYQEYRSGKFAGPLADHGSGEYYEIPCAKATGPAPIAK